RRSPGRAHDQGSPARRRDRSGGCTPEPWRAAGIVARSHARREGGAAPSLWSFFQSHRRIYGGSEPAAQSRRRVDKVTIMTEPNDTGQYLELLRRQAQTRRQFVGLGAGGLGAFFLNDAFAKTAPAGGLNFARDPSTPLSVLPPQFPAKAKRVIYLHMGGAPSQLELFDHKPQLARFNGH